MLIENSRLRTKMNVTNAWNCSFVFKTNSQTEKISLNQNFTSILNSCEQKHGTNLVNITKNCKFFILLITPRLTLKIWLIVYLCFSLHVASVLKAMNHTFPIILIIKKPDKKFTSSSQIFIFIIRGDCSYCAISFSLNQTRIM